MRLFAPDSVTEKESLSARHLGLALLDEGLLGQINFYEIGDMMLKPEMPWKFKTVFSHLGGGFKALWLVCGKGRKRVLGSTGFGRNRIRSNEWAAPNQANSVLIESAPMMLKVLQRLNSANSTRELLKVLSSSKRLVARMEKESEDAPDQANRLESAVALR